MSQWLQKRSGCRNQLGELTRPVWSERQCVLDISEPPGSLSSFEAVYAVRSVLQKMHHKITGFLEARSDEPTTCPDPRTSSSSLTVSASNVRLLPHGVWQSYLSFEATTPAHSEAPALSTTYLANRGA